MFIKSWIRGSLEIARNPHTLNNAITLAKNLHVFTCKTKYLFIMSHMRSRSSLLSHILASNPEICGYTEQHLSYKSKLDLVRLRASIFLETGKEMDQKYVLDKILHNNLSLSPKTLNKENSIFIFLIREPERTLKSIVKSSLETDFPHWRDQYQASSYYISRLSKLQDYAEALNKKFFFIESDDLINDATHVLEDLTNWLMLRDPLNTNYSLFQKTGIRGYGDPLPHIKSGKIIKTSPTSEIEISQTVLEKSKLAYKLCKENLSKNCIFS